MGLRDVTGVFSRYFAVGFFAPAFSALLVSKLALSDDFLPSIVEADDGSAIGVVAGAALVLALLLEGVEKQVLALFGAYYSAIAILGKRLGFAKRQATKARTWEGKRRQIYLRYFPELRPIAPTALGNLLRASGEYLGRQWGLNEWSAAYRLDALLTEPERKLQADSKAEVYLFLNGALAALLVPVLLAIDIGLGHDSSRWLLIACAPGWVLAYVLYRAAFRWAQDWLSYTLAGYDLHRFDLYAQLGIRQPTSVEEERTTIGPAITDLLESATPIPREFYAAPRPR